jgi:hypothetical protein
VKIRLAPSGTTIMIAVYISIAIHAAIVAAVWLDTRRTP